MVVETEIKLRLPDGPEPARVRLRFRPEDYITSSYGALYEEHRQKHHTVPRDMKFHHP